VLSDIVPTNLENHMPMQQISQQPFPEKLASSNFELCMLRLYMILGQEDLHRLVKWSNELACLRGLNMLLNLLGIRFEGITNLKWRGISAERSRFGRERHSMKLEIRWFIVLYTHSIPA
jgi:hypothetical protein